MTLNVTDENQDYKNNAKKKKQNCPYAVLGYTTFISKLIQLQNTNHLETGASTTVQDYAQSV